MRKLDEPMVEPFGMDECWLDVTGSRYVCGDARTIAENIRRSVKEELGLTVSIGVSFNNVFAKLGSDLKKPDAITEISPDSYKEKVWPLPCSDMISCNGHTYRLVHAAPAYMFAEYNHWNWGKTTFCVWYRIRKEDVVSDDETLIFGHIPTYRYSHGLPVSIWRGQNRIDIDCGAGHGYGGRLACLRLDDMVEFYVDVL